MAKDGIAIRGFSRLRIVEGPDHRIVGDSGWLKNRIPNEGLDNYLTRLISAQAQSAQISLAMLGTGTLPATDGTSLPGELNTATYSRTTVSVSLVDSSAVEFQFTYDSTDSHITAAVTLQNVGIINNTTSAGSLFAGNTYATSQWNTNQSINGSYRITFTGA